MERKREKSAVDDDDNNTTTTVTICYSAMADNLDLNTVYSVFAGCVRLCVCVGKDRINWNVGGLPLVCVKHFRFNNLRLLSDNTSRRHNYIYMRIACI